MEHQPIENLLAQVSILQRKYEEIAALTGENFNIFRVLKVEAREVRTHSAFLSELLHPKGSHGLGDVFLKLFLEQVRVENLEGKEIQYDARFALAEFQPEHAKAQAEYHIGSKTEDAGGRMDILVTSRSNKLIIENKIYAGDQENQLVRYHNFDRTAPLYYLTLWANQRPAEHSGGDLKEGEHYKRISYEIEIMEWLEKCREKAANRALLRETITQYIYLIKHLTHKSLNKNMENELIGLVMKSEGSFKAYEALRSLNILATINNKVAEQFKGMAQKMGLKFIDGGPDGGGKVYLLESDALSALNLQIGFCFYVDSFDYGFAYEDGNKSKDEALNTYLQAQMAQCFPKRRIPEPTLHWPVWQNKAIDFELLRAIWEGRLGEKLEELMGKLLGMVRGYEGNGSS